MTPNPFDLWSVVDKAGTIGCLIVMIMALGRRWVVPSYVADDLKAQGERMREERNQAQAVADRCLATLQQLADSLPQARQRLRGGPP